MAPRLILVPEVSYGPRNNCGILTNITKSVASKHKLHEIFFRNGVSNHSFKFSDSTIGILLANAFMSNEVRTPQQEALLCLRRNRETTLTNDMSGCASSVRIQKGGRSWVQKHSFSWWQGKRKGARGVGWEISSMWGRVQPVHFHILYCQFNFPEVDRSAIGEAYPWLHQVGRNSVVGKETVSIFPFYTAARLGFSLPCLCHW